MKVLITCTYKITDIRTFYLFIDPNLTITAFLQRIQYSIKIHLRLFLL